MRRKTVLSIVAPLAAVIVILPTTGLASQFQSAVRATPSAARAGSNRDTALFKLAFNRIRALQAGLTGLNGKLSTANRDIAGLKTKVATAQGDIATLKTNVTSASGDISTLKTNVSTAQSDIATIKGELSAGATALSQLSTAIQDPTTGLVGLNKARPQFGAFQTNGTIIAGTGQVTGASGPKANATEGSTPLANSYVVDFGNDVSQRFLQVTQFPTGGASTNRLPMAVDCAASAGASTLCGAVEGVASDNSPNHVVVQFGAAGTTAADNSWEVAAISG